MKHPSLRWIAALVVLLALVGLGWRGYQARQAAQQAQMAPAPTPAIELRDIDVARATLENLNLTLPISGTLHAVRSAVVKARVPGELQGLTVREGDHVQAGQVLARVEPVEYAERLRQAERQAESARAQVEIAQRQYDNNAALAAQGFISKTALDNSRASLEGARAAWAAAQAGTEVVRKSLADTVLRAPIGGEIAQRLAQPGERVAPEARIVEIVDPSQLELEAAVSPADSLVVRVGQPASLRVEGSSTVIAATVARINPSAQAANRSVLAYLTVAPAPGLRQGLFVEGRLGIGHERTLAIPLSAVRTDKPEPYVQMIEENAGAARIVHRKVTTGARAELDGETWVAVQGVPEGARVLRGAAGVLREGTLVRLDVKP